MAYEKQNFLPGQKLKASELNHMEEGIADAVSVTEQTLSEEQKAQARENIGAENALNFAAYGLPVLELTGDVSAMTKDNAVNLAYKYGERSGTASVKWQGSSSIYYPKKNYTIKFDNAFEAVEGWGEQKKYCLKANFIDHSHSRNVVSGKLWGKTVKSRTTANEKLNALPNGGAIDGFPIVVALNGEFHGLYTFNIPKDGWMFGMGTGESAGESATENLEFDTYSTELAYNYETKQVEYTPTTTVGSFHIRKRSTLSGGRAYFDWDVNKLMGFVIRAYLYDASGNVCKILCGHNGIMLNPYYEKMSGDLGEEIWLDATSRNDPMRPDAPFSVPVPEGHSVLWEIQLPNAAITFPDGTLTKDWSSEAEQNNRWVFTWVKTGISTTIVDKGGNEKTEVMPFDTWIVADSMNPVTGEYTATKSTTSFYVKKSSGLSGGRSYVTWDTNKIVGGIRVKGHLYDENGNHVKVFAGAVDDVVNSFWAPAGDYDASVWKTATESAGFADPTAPFSVAIPEGHTVIWEFQITQHFTSPDGSIVEDWSSETEANNTWYLAWAKEGIQTYVVSDDRKEAIFCAEGTSEATRFQTEATFDGHNFKLEYATDEDNASWAFTSINRLIRACINSDGADLDTTIAKYLDWDSAIDYYIYACLLGGADMAGKNYLLATYNGTKWFFSAYDMDSTFGLWWDGKKFLPSNHYPTINWYAAYHKAMELIKNYKKDKFKARYAELRAGALSESAVAEAFSNFVAKIPSPVLVEDVKKWPTIPSSSASNLAQILNWYRMRVQVIDKEVETL